jgi:hypothetical protein
MGLRQREEGACYAYSRADGSSYSLRRSEHARLKVEWMAGRAFFTGLGFYGSELTLKLGDIVAISDVAPEHIASATEDQRANESDDALNL